MFAKFHYLEKPRKEISRNSGQYYSTWHFSSRPKKKSFFVFSSREEAKHHGGDLEKEFKRLLISQAVQSKKKRVEEKLVNNFCVGLERYFLTTLTFNTSQDRLFFRRAP